MPHSDGSRSRISAGGGEIIRYIQIFIVALLIGAFILACAARSTPNTDIAPVTTSSTAEEPEIPIQRIPVVKTQTGDVSGGVDNGVFAFKGIPFAAPPVGDLRWREPKPGAAWKGVRKGDAFGNACIQVPGLSAAVGDPSTYSEDCLYLNVWTAKADSSAKLPVMVWIYGGAYIFGSGAVPGYSGAPVAKKGAVVVNFNYRVAQLGFFAHPALEKENPGGPANFGLLDQIAALKWVQQNIAQFGGDPNNVTILGQSAGAKSVLALYSSPLALGLFQKGIAMSTYALPDATRAKAIEVGTKVADAVGLKGANATAAELRAVPAEKFGPLTGTALSLAPVPISGDTVLPISIQGTFTSGKEAPLPLLIGDTSNDSSVAAAFGIDTAKVLGEIKGAGIAMKVLYPGIKDDRMRADKAVRDIIFTSPVRAIADNHSKLAPSWRYYFDYIAVKERANYPNGVPHGGEICYFLDTCDLNISTKDIFTDADRDYSRQASGYLFEFARTGMPVSSGGPFWPQHDDRNDGTMIFGEMMEVEKNFMKTRLNIFLKGSKLLGPMLKRKKH
ncbi:MAG: carboxylesterase family protein [Pyrinomonadaceae bacterium]